MKFKKGDEVTINGFFEAKAVVPKPDSEGVIIVTDEDGVYIFAKEHEATLKPKTQNWFGIEIDAFDTELPGRDQRYYFYDAMYQSNYQCCYYQGDGDDTMLLRAGYWLDEEKAKRSAPKMYKRICEMAKGE